MPKLTLNVLDTRNGRFAEFSGSDLSLRDQTLFARSFLAPSYDAHIGYASFSYRC